jgi:hypothetical protein
MMTAVGHQLPRKIDAIPGTGKTEDAFLRSITC